MINIFNSLSLAVSNRKGKLIYKPPLFNTLSVLENLILSFNKVSCKFSFFNVLTLSNSLLSENKKKISVIKKSLN